MGTVTLVEPGHTICVFVVFIGRVAKDGCDLQGVFAGFFLGSEHFIILDEQIHTSHRHHIRKLSVVCFSGVVVDDVVCDLIQPVVTFEQLFGVDRLYIDIKVVGTLFFFVSADILDTELQYIVVIDGIRDHILVETIIKEFSGSSLAQFVSHCIFDKDRRAGKPYRLILVKKLADPHMCFTKLASVALIKDKDDMFLFQPLHTALIPGFTDGGIELLYGRHDEFRIITELLDQCSGVVCSVHRPIAKAVELFGRLVVQVFSIYDKHYFVHMGQVHQYLSCLKGSECLA